jgi:hypothetical protein
VKSTSFGFGHGEHGTQEQPGQPFHLMNRPKTFMTVSWYHLLGNRLLSTPKTSSSIGSLTILGVFSFAG